MKVAIWFVFIASLPVSAECITWTPCLIQADNATVLREGRLSVVPRAELVPGDVVEVAGDNLHPCLCRQAVPKERDVDGLGR